MPAGRPSDYTPDVAGAICDRMADGESLVSICREDAMPDRRTVYRWLDAHEEFRHKYARAVELRVEHWGDEILDIVDESGFDATVVDGRAVIDGEAIGRARLRMDARKWLMSKLLPKKYGDLTRLTGGDGEGPVLTKDVSDMEKVREIAWALRRASGDAG